MRRFYSFMLMATMLLISANVWAFITVEGDATPYADLQTAINTVGANDSATITLSQTGLTLSSAVMIKDGRKICLDLGGFTIQDAGTGCFELVKGTLHIKNGTVHHATASTTSNVTKSAIIVFGAPWEHKTEVWSTLIVDEDAIVSTVQSTYQFGITLDVTDAHSGLKDIIGYTTSIQNQPTKPSDKCSVKDSGNKYDSGCAFGVRILIKSGAKVYGYQRGINVAGNINSTPDCDGASSLYPYIKIESRAEVWCYNGNGAGGYMTSGNGGIYAGGYTIMDISGNVHGQTGILVKSGEINLVDATVTSDCSAVATSGNYKGNVAGTGIFIASDAGYAGDVDLTIEGNTTVQGGGYAAIVDVLASNASTTNVDNIELNSGSIVGGSQGAIVLTTGTVAETTVYAANIEGNILKKDGDAEPENLTESTDLGGMIKGTTTPDNQGPTNFNQNADYVLNVVPASQSESGKPEIEVKPNTSKVVTMNNAGYASFSATVARQIANDDNANSTLHAYYASSTGDRMETADDVVLKLTEISDGVIPANTGVIFIGTPGETYILGTNTSTSAIANNLLKPATAWSYPADPINYTTEGYIQGIEHEHAYVLSGEYLYKYTGDLMKVNKAYLDLSSDATPLGAPARVRMVIAETQDVENIEAGKKAVKFIQNGNILIKRGEKIYNVQGQIVK